MKKTIIALLALSSMAMAAGTTVTNAPVIISSDQDYIYLDANTSTSDVFDVKIVGDVTIGTMDGFGMANVKGLNLDLTEGTLNCTGQFKPGSGAGEVLNFAFGEVSTTGATKFTGGMISFTSNTSTVNITATVDHDNILEAAYAAGNGLASITLMSCTNNGWSTNNVAQDGHMFLTLTGLGEFGYTDGGIWFLKNGVYTLASTVSSTSPTTTTDLAATLGEYKYAIVMDDCNVNTGMKALRLVATTPEPATATLSLLALAGLASRRRRH